MTNARFVPVLLCLGAVFLLTIMNGIIKALSGGYDTLQISFLRYLCGSCWISLLVLWQRPRLPERKDFPAHFARGVLGAISGTTFFYALPHLSLADTFTISFLAPLFVTILSLLFLRETPRLVDLLALGLGFSGMLIIVSGADGGGGTRSLFGIVCVAISAITYALTLVLLRSLAQRDAFAMLVLFQHVISTVLLAPFGLALWTTPAPLHLAGFALAAGLGVLGHLLMASAYSRAPAARLAPLEYSALIYAAAIDLVWFGNRLSFDTVLGALAIIGAAVLATRR